MKFLLLLRSKIVSVFRFVSWFFFDTPIEGKPMFELMGDFVPNELPEILEMRKEIIDLEGQVRALRNVNNAFLNDRFGTYEAENLDINTLQLQYGSFFINAAFERHFAPDELMFFRRTFMQAIACAYQLGLKKDDRATKSVG